MDISELDYQFPNDLIATERAAQSRVMWVNRNGPPRELTWTTFLSQFNSEDLIVVNNSKVIKARIFSSDGLEILFIEPLDRYRWQVLCPARQWKKGQAQELPGGVKAYLVASGLPQIVELSQAIDQNYFKRFGEMPLPPYIQKARGERHQSDEDELSYQSIFAKKEGSLAAPTASLHFGDEDLTFLKGRGVQIAELCLHVGLGTFLPITSDKLEDHKMHREVISVPDKTIEQISQVREMGGRVWALGTTVARSIESYGQNKLKKCKGGFQGESDLFIYPPYQFKLIDGLLTNFHQPRSTLLAMIYAFAGKEEAREAYAYAIERKFRLFSYGDLCVFEGASRG